VSMRWRLVWVKMRHAAWQSPWQHYLQNRMPQLIGANLRRDRWRCAAGLPQKAAAPAVALGFRVGPTPDEDLSRETNIWSISSHETRKLNCGGKPRG
jgi:hypothetical protein